jgi:predicted Fe-Mo cluster-binding NifX family protein
MILLISAQQQQLDSLAEERFGRSPWFIQINTETRDWKALENPGGTKAGGAGVAAAQFVLDQKADAVISGYYGPNAADVLRAAHIDMYFLPEKRITVVQALEAFLQGELTQSGAASN